MKRFILSAVVSLALGVGVAVVNAEEARVETPYDSPVRVEMRLLDPAFKNLLDSLILNKPEAIKAPFIAVHKALGNTDAALKKGEVKVPRNNDKMKEFKEMDEKFHKLLEQVIAASNKRDMKKVQAITHKIIDGCVQCHSQYLY
ncbi:MAG: hypothetical protein NTW44_03980 [Nitrospirae bacterium]|nr:hypothetical protein [Nitrospirota bacterium]